MAGNSPGNPFWTVNAGRGFGGPVVKDGKAYLPDRDDKVVETLRCLYLPTGMEHWHYAGHAPGTAIFPGSRDVPTLDGNRGCSCGPNGDLYCIDTNTHKVVWRPNQASGAAQGLILRPLRNQQPQDGKVCMTMDGKDLWATRREQEFNKDIIILADRLILATDGAQTL